MKSLEILKYLMETPHGVTLKTIAREFSVSERTIKRHLARIRKAGFVLMFTAPGANVAHRFWVES